MRQNVQISSDFSDVFRHKRVNKYPFEFNVTLLFFEQIACLTKLTLSRLEIK